jgi:hypothetical protein
MPVAGAARKARRRRYARCAAPQHQMCSSPRVQARQGCATVTARTDVGPDSVDVALSFNSMGLMTNKCDDHRVGVLLAATRCHHSG